MSYAKYGDLGNSTMQPSANPMTQSGPANQIPQQSTEQPEVQKESNIKMISTQDEKTVVIGENSVVVLYIYAPWCGPCKTIAPEYERMAGYYNSSGKCILAKEDVEDDMSPHVTAVPTFEIYSNGERVATITGANLRGVEDTFRKYL